MEPNERPEVQFKRRCQALEDRLRQGFASYAECVEFGQQLVTLYKEVMAFIQSHKRTWQGLAEALQCRTLCLSYLDKTVEFEGVEDDDTPELTSLINELKQNLGEEPDLDLKNWRQLCSLAGVNPLIEKFLSPEVIDEIEVQVGDSEDSQAILAVILDAVINAFVENDPDIELETEHEASVDWITNYLVCLTLLNAYPSWIDNKFAVAIEQAGRGSIQLPPHITRLIADFINNHPELRRVEPI